MINELRKAIDDYWESKRKTYAKGRIKRMRKGNVKSVSQINLTWAYNHWKRDKVFYLLLHFPLTRWNKH